MHEHADADALELAQVGLYRACPDRPCCPMSCSMKISHGIREELGAELGAVDDESVAAGMRAKSEEFAASGNRVYLPLTDGGR